MDLVRVVWFLMVDPFILLNADKPPSVSSTFTRTVFAAFGGTAIGSGSGSTGPTISSGSRLELFDGAPFFVLVDLNSLAFGSVVTDADFFRLAVGTDALAPPFTFLGIFCPVLRL